MLRITSIRRAALAAASVTAVAAGALGAVAPAASAAGVSVRHACAAPTHAGQMTCLALVRTDVKEPAALTAQAVSPAATPSGYGPTGSSVSSIAL